MFKGSFKTRILYLFIGVSGLEGVLGFGLLKKATLFFTLIGGGLRSSPPL